MLNMESYNLEELGQEADAEEDLGWSRHAPVQKINQRHDAVRLKHVISVLTKSTENSNNFNAKLDGLA